MPSSMVGSALRTAMTNAWSSKAMKGSSKRALRGSAERAERERAERDDPELLGEHLEPGRVERDDQGRAGELPRSNVTSTLIESLQKDALSKRCRARWPRVR